MPITARDGANAGYLQLSDKYEGEFTQQDEYVATELAQLVSIALQNVTLLAEVTDLNTGLEEKVTQRTAELRLSNDEMKTFSYSVSHDLRAPLASVDGFSRALAAELGAQTNPKVRHYLARIQDNVEKMNQLIEGLLSLAHLSQLELVREPVDLSAISGELLQQFRAEGREGAFTVEAGLVVNADRRLMLSVMENLLGNAWKFSSRREHPEISVGWSSQREAFFVRDNGAGFDMAYADKLFVPFQRLHGQSEFAGTGVGLSTVSRVVARHGGRIWGESEPDKGATFFFKLNDAVPGK